LLHRALGYKGIILGVTGNGHQPEIDLFLKAGADRVLIKPLSAEQFYEVLLGEQTHS
jgi:BarA-like signal transduction histidine kinase